MQFVDATLIRLADPATRTALFDEPALAALVDAGYDAAQLTVGPPYVPVFDEFRLGFYAPRIGSVEGTWQASGGADRREASFRVTGLGDDAAIRVDGIWRGSIVARAQPTTSRIVSVDVANASFDGIDDEIAAALGALPKDPAALEQQRRDRLIPRLQAVAGDPAVVTPGFVDAWLADGGGGSAADLLAAQSGRSTSGTSVTFSPPQGPPPGPVPLPVAVAILIRDEKSSVAQLLAETKAVRDILEPLGLDRRRPTELHPRARVLIAWILPALIFDDGDWPTPGGAGPARDRRRRAATKWLAMEGIGLVTVG